MNDLLFKCNRLTGHKENDKVDGCAIFLKIVKELPNKDSSWCCSFEGEL